MIRLYTVKDDYIDFLRRYEPKVLFNKQERRPYVGIVFAVNSINYYVPLSSPKPKFSTMKNAIDFHKIANGKYGAINFNKMIPISNDDLTLIDINKEPNMAYRSLLQNQFAELLNIKGTILNKSTNLYNLYKDTRELSKNEIRVKGRCCNFPLLEWNMLEYIEQKNPVVSDAPIISQDGRANA